MKLSRPIYHLKREARRLSRAEQVPLHEALDRIAVREGFTRWSLLASKAREPTPARRLYDRLAPGELILIGARPGHGKTLLGLELATCATASGHRGVFFTLEYTARDVVEGLRAIGVEPAQLDERFVLDCSDAISADHIVGALITAPPGTLAVVDYLQLLDQKRANPDLMTQVRTLKDFARERGLILVFLSQIDRSYDPTSKPHPDLADVRLPNPLDLALFDATCFLNEGEIRSTR